MLLIKSFCKLQVINLIENINNDDFKKMVQKCIALTNEEYSYAFQPDCKSPSKRALLEAIKKIRGYLVNILTI